MTTSELRALLEAAADRAIAYATTVDERPVAPDEAALAGLAAFDEPLPEGGSDPAEVLRLLDDAGSPATVANASCLAAARDALLLGAGWDVQSQGLFGAPPITVVVGAQRHSTLSKSLGLIGLGRDRVTVVPADDQGTPRRRDR